jgi:aminoglycoside phosphotransferase (APT) family kinase protein
MKFRGGQSNPTYRVSTPGGVYVLRKKPTGVLVPSAHAIDREFRVIQALHAHGFPTPAPILYCEDDGVVGTPFYLVSAIDGRVFWDVEMPEATPEERRAVYESVVDTLAQLHGYDVDQLGLSDFGPPGDYLERQITRWSRQASTSPTLEAPDLAWVAGALAERRPKQARRALIHGDYGLHNILIQPDRPQVAAVLDWEVSTVGDPLADLAHHLAPWFLPPDSERHSVSTLVGRDLGALGLPNLDEYSDRYCAQAGLARFTDRDFYVAFALFRYAAIIQGILERVHRGSAVNSNVLHTPHRVFLLAAQARRLLE